MNMMEWLADEMSMSSRDVIALASSAPFRYKVYEIAKRTGGTRTIAQPAKEIKPLQRLLVKWLEQRLPVHESATAYVRGKGIRCNAAVHASNSCILKLDFEDFFPSIRPHDFRAHWAEYGGDELSREEMQLIVRLLFWRPRSAGSMRLSIGAPSSPFISNTLMYKFDELVLRFSQENSCAYTRYADDITISSGRFEVLSIAEKYIKSELSRIAYPRLNINPNKTAYVSKKFQRRVTGLVLSNDGHVSLGRERKRKLQAAIHHYVCGNLASEDVSKLCGMIAFVADVEPEFIVRMETKYGEDVVRSLLHHGAA